MPPTVSAIITTHNRITLLPRAIKSVLEQTYPCIELIVVDDASTDGTRDYCQSQPLKYIYIPKEQSRGGNYARNLGVRSATGKYVAFLDDDDYWLPTKIEKQVALIESNDCELVHCGKRKEIVKGDNVIYVDTLSDPLHYGNMKKKILLTICTTTTNILALRQSIIDVGMFDEKLRFWQEYELTIRLAQRKPFYFVNEPLSVYRIDEHDGQRLTNKYYEWKDTVRYIHNKHRELYAKLNIFERFRVFLLVLKDASLRAGASNLHFKHLYLYITWFILAFPFRAVDKIRRMQIQKTKPGGGVDY